MEYESDLPLDEPIYDYSNTENDLEQEKNNFQTFYISRHLNSCNNMVDNIKWTNPSYKFSEPPLSMWGVISGLALQREPLPSGQFKNTNTVHVSCLIRTWMTAIIEYLPYSAMVRGKGRIINLIVSPYIKESDLSDKYYVGQTVDKGNMPIDIDEQLEKIKYFFSFLVLIQKYVNQLKSKTISENKQESYNNNISKIKKNLDTILFHKNNINIIFPSIKNRKDVKISLEYDDTNKKLMIDTNELYEEYSYFDKIPKDKELILEMQQDKNKDDDEEDYDDEEDEEEQEGGGNMDENFIYFEKVLNSFLEQNVENDHDKIINLPLKQKSIKIKSISKKDVFGRIPNVTAYTKSFGKESILLFIDWVKNVRKNKDKDIYVVAHSNIMQATLYNICEKIKNTVIKKKNVDECQSGLRNIVKNQNIWELILKVKDENVIKFVQVRQGQEKPNDISKKVLNYGKEKALSCGNNIANINKIIKENELIKKYTDVPKNQNKNKIIVQKGIKQQQSTQQQSHSQPQILESNKNNENLGFFGKLKNFFTRGKRGGRGRRKKQSQKNINKYKKNITANKKRNRNRNRNKKTYKK